jgi:nucleoside-diphosphate-sugar epimerase
MTITGKRVFITGASGFVGSRLVEHLVQQHDCTVRALVHRSARVPRIARFPVQLVSAEITDKKAIASSMAGCDLVIHAAMGTSSDVAEHRRVNVQGTEAILEAAAACNVERVVHLSTVAVYGHTSDGDLCESSRRGRLFDEYCRTKSEGENLAFHYHRHHGVPVTILQPTVVYGPFAGGWTVAPLVALKNKRVILPEGGDGICNAVYIEDLVQAITLASCRQEAIGQPFLISGAEPITWKAFYGHYETMLGVKSTVAMSESELRRLRSPWRRLPNSLVRVALHPEAQELIHSTAFMRIPYQIARSLMPRRLRKVLSPDVPPTRSMTDVARPVHLMEPGWFRWQTARTYVSIDKARSSLGYHPRYSVAQGMKLTRKWAEWAGLVSEQHIQQSGAGAQTSDGRPILCTTSH